MLAPHVLDLTGPSSGAFYKLYVQTMVCGNTRTTRHVQPLRSNFVYLVGLHTRMFSNSLSLEVPLQRCRSEIPASNFGPKTAYRAWNCSWFPHLLQANARTVYRIGPQPFAFLLFLSTEHSVIFRRVILDSIRMEINHKQMNLKWIFASSLCYEISWKKMNWQNQ